VDTIGRTGILGEAAMLNTPVMSKPELLAMLSVPIVVAGAAGVVIPMPWGLLVCVGAAVATVAFIKRTVRRRFRQQRALLER
jgi:membrane protein implicated in regulation of membrane protease activity